MTLPAFTSSSACLMDFIVSSSSRMSRVSMISSSRLVTFKSRVRSSSVKRTLVLGMSPRRYSLDVQYFNISPLFLNAVDRDINVSQT